MRITSQVTDRDYLGKPSRLLRYVDDAGQEAAEEMLAEMQERTPVKSGRLLASEQIQQTGPHTWEVVATAPYAGAVEERTPFAAPAADAVTDSFEARIAAAVDRLTGRR